VAALRKRGLWLDADQAESDRLALDEPLLAACYNASLLGFPRPPQDRTLASAWSVSMAPLRCDHDHDSPQEAGKPPKNAYGFDAVHEAGVRVPAHDKKRLERLACYAARPPNAHGKQRLTRLEDGRYSLRLKRPYDDGTTHIVMDGAALMERLVALGRSDLLPSSRESIWSATSVSSRHTPSYARRWFRRPRRSLRARTRGTQPPTSPGAPTVPTPTSLPPGALAALGGRNCSSAFFRLTSSNAPSASLAMQRLAFITRPSAIAAILASVSPSTGPPREQTAEPMDGLDEERTEELFEQVSTVNILEAP